MSLVIMIITNKTAADIYCPQLGETIPASSTLEVDDGNVYTAAQDPIVRVSFAADNIDISLNGIDVPHDLFGASVMSDIGFQSIQIP